MKLPSFALFGGGFQDFSNFSMFTSPDIMEDDLVDTRIYFFANRWGDLTNQNSLPVCLCTGGLVRFKDFCSVMEACVLAQFGYGRKRTNTCIRMFPKIGVFPPKRMVKRMENPIF